VIFSLYSQSFAEALNDKNDEDVDNIDNVNHVHLDHVSHVDRHLDRVEQRCLIMFDDVDHRR